MDLYFLLNYGLEIQLANLRVQLLELIKTFIFPPIFVLILSASAQT
jgi:hypothetical protein